MIIRKATTEDLPEIMTIYENARNFMREVGNPDQWSNTHPPYSLVASTLSDTYLCVKDDIVACVFYYSNQNDPTYDIIYEGAWKNDAPYGVVHRIASSRKIKGAARFALNWAFSQCGNLKIDTHRDNVPMQNLLKSSGFEYCGIIHLENGDERLAFQKEGTK